VKPDQLHHSFVGTEHLLLGLMALGQGVAVNVLRTLGLKPEAVRAEIVNCVGIGPDQKLIGNPLLTPRAKRVLTLADKERKALHHTYLGTEHILLGLLRDGDGVAARVLVKLHLDLVQVRQEWRRATARWFTATSGSIKRISQSNIRPT
jgi:ATP-dependent Clp protease ATP-binding subunit ClpC